MCRPLKRWYQKTIIPRLLNMEMGSEKFAEIRRAVLAEATGTVLEIGVGPGYTLPLYKHITRLYALDPSKGLIEIAKTRAHTLAFPVDFLLAEAEHLPLPDHSVDTVVSMWTLCSVSDPQRVLHEIKRVLRPRGLFVFVDHGASSNPLLCAIQTWLTPITKHFTGNCHYNRRIEELILEAGFCIKRMNHPGGTGKLLIYHYQGIAVPC